jgi:hypothetical protein
MSIPTTIIKTDDKVGHWRVLRVVHRRALCQCRCGVTHEVSVDVLASGESTSCGCSPLSKPKNKNNVRPFAVPDWRPQR